IEKHGAEHMETGDLIVYTSADSVFQIAAHEDVVPIEMLYRYSQIARDLLTGQHAVGRVIARPFIGRPGSFTRTVRRKDFSLTPSEPTMLDHVKAAGLPVVSVGKISDIFAGRGVTDALVAKENDQGVSVTLEAMRDFDRGLIFTNLVDFDMKYGHRNDSKGYANALEAFDIRLPEIIAALRPDDLLLITADHGCDPNFPGTDHTRESVPLLMLTAAMQGAYEIGVRNTFADIGVTVCDWLGTDRPLSGTSILPLPAHA
ncbi:MAG TPA: phosphopentomutase, partial [Clostridiaceae bacterium]|nr:phosphopentomutase [Clostridiaceae bacterium]